MTCLDLSLVMAPSLVYGPYRLEFFVFFEFLDDELPILPRSELGMVMEVDILRKRKSKRRG